jgi:hypothetical protein
VLFDKLPTYKEIVSGTQNLAELTGLNELFKLKNVNKSLVVTSLDKRWNVLVPSLYLLHQKLERLGIVMTTTYHDEALRHLP